MTAAEILAEQGIRTRSTAPGRYYTTCPKCSHTRKGSHKTLRCLGVTIDEAGCRWGCNHCEFKGGKFYDDQRKASPVAGKPRHQRRDGFALRHLYG